MTTKVSKQLHWDRLIDLLMFSLHGTDEERAEVTSNWSEYVWSTGIKGRRGLTPEQRAANREQWVFDEYRRAS